MKYSSTRKTPVSVTPMEGSVSVTPGMVDEVQPKKGKHLDRALFGLARRLKGYPEFDGDVELTRPIVEEWYSKAKSIIGGDWASTWTAFCNTWRRVLCPDIGENPLDVALALAKREPLPDLAGRYRAEGVRLLVALCYQLQRMTGKGPFFLACRDAGRLLGVDRMTAARWLRKLNRDGVIFVIEKGGPRTNKATRYWYRNTQIPRY